MNLFFVVFLWIDVWRFLHQRLAPVVNGNRDLIHLLWPLPRKGPPKCSINITFFLRTKSYCLLWVTTQLLFLLFCLFENLLNGEGNTSSNSIVQQECRYPSHWTVFNLPSRVRHMRQLYYEYVSDLSLNLAAGHYGFRLAENKKSLISISLLNHQGLALLTLSWDKNWDSHSLVNGYPSFYRRIASVAPSPGR